MIRKTTIAVLLLSTIGAASLWMLSYWKPFIWQSRDIDSIPTPNTVALNRIPMAFEIELRDGQFIAGYLYHICGNPRISEFAFAGVRSANLFVQRAGRRGSIEKMALIVPLWQVTLLLAIYPGFAFIRHALRPYQRRRRGLCLKCGYNLEGNESGLCPECGEETRTL